MRLFQPLISALIAVSTLGPLFAQDPPRPAYQFMRYDEDWSVLSDRSRRSDWLDPVKYISFGAPGWYVTFGGESSKFSPFVMLGYTWLHRSKVTGLRL
jgi:hypothetical protein